MAEKQTAAQCRGECSWLFAELDPHALDRLYQLSRTVQYGPSEMIFQEGEPAFGLYIICAGKVKLSKYASHGKKQILKLLGPGEILGEKTMFDRDVYTAHAKTLETTTLHFFERNEFLDFVKHFPQVGLRLLEKLSREIKGFQSKLVEIAYEGSTERLARLLLLIAKEYGFSVEQGTDIGLELSRADLAELAGISTETAIRTLSKFKERGLIDMEGHRIVLLDKAKLLKISEPFVVALKENLL